MLVSGEPLLTPGLFLRSLFGPGRRPPAFSFSRGRIQHFSYGRQALATGLRSLPPGDVLCPAYICDTVADAIRAAGRQPRYYRVTEDLEPDWPSMPGTAGAAAFLLVHYFGLRSDLDSAAAFAAEGKIALIEDCAHALLSSASGSDAGTRGQLAVYSWRKFLPVARGGALVTNAGIQTQRPDPEQAEDPSVFGGYGDAGRQLAKWALFRSGSMRALEALGAVLSDERPPHASIVAGRQSPDRHALRILSATAPELARAAHIHSANYAALHDRLASLPLRLLPRPPEGPWCLPVFLETGAVRDAVLEALLRQGIGAWIWPELPPGVTVADWPEAVDLAGRTLCLPVHVDITAAAIDRMANTLSSLLVSGR